MHFGLPWKLTLGQGQVHGSVLLVNFPSSYVGAQIFGFLFFFSDSVVADLVVDLRFVILDCNSY